MRGFIPYCGVAPDPATLHWNTDPVLISCLVFIAVLYCAGMLRGKEIPRRERISFALGFGILAIALISPLCNLSVALFSARIAQHIVLTLVAAPLIVLGSPLRALAVFWPRSAVRTLNLSPGQDLLLSSVLFAICIWIWHAPGPYNATLQSNAVYWLMHLSTFGAALLLWTGLIRYGATNPGPVLAGGFATAMQMSVLGAVLTFATRPLFIVHVGTTEVWQLSQLEDQQLGGLIMWVPGGLLLMAYALFAVWQLLRTSPSLRPLPSQTGVLA